MIIGACSVPRVIEESTCRTSKDYYFGYPGDYYIHSTALMPNIPFGYAATFPCSIDSSIFVNASDTTLRFSGITWCQNYLSTEYLGPLCDETKIPMGTQFVLRCKNNDPSPGQRRFSVKETKILLEYDRDEEGFTPPDIPEEDKSIVYWEDLKSKDIVFWDEIGKNVVRLLD